MSDEITAQHIEAAQTAARWFETTTRPDGTTFVRIKDQAGETVPAWIYEAVKSAHGGMLPDDYVYSYASEAFDAIAKDTFEGSDPWDTSANFADGVDVYSADLMTWLSSHTQRRGRVDEALAEATAETVETGADDAPSLDRLIMRAQYEERREVFDAIWQAVSDHVDEIDDDDETDA